MEEPIAAHGVSVTERVSAFSRFDLTPLRLRNRLEVANSVARTADGTRIVLGRDNGKVRVWDVTTQKCLQVFMANLG
jgi:hypothetical protein